MITFTEEILNGEPYFPVKWQYLGYLKIFEDGVLFEAMAKS